jgi:hypothetical protein
MQRFFERQKTSPVDDLSCAACSVNNALGRHAVDIGTLRALEGNKGLVVSGDTIGKWLSTKNVVNAPVNAKRFQKKDDNSWLPPPTGTYIVTVDRSKDFKGFHSVAVKDGKVFDSYENEPTDAARGTVVIARRLHDKPEPEEEVKSSSGVVDLTDDKIYGSGKTKFIMKDGKLALIPVMGTLDADAPPPTSARPPSPPPIPRPIMPTYGPRPGEFPNPGASHYDRVDNAVHRDDIEVAYELSPPSSPEPEEDKRSEQTKKEIADVIKLVWGPDKTSEDMRGRGKDDTDGKTKLAAIRAAAAAAEAERQQQAIQRFRRTVTDDTLMNAQMAADNRARNEVREQAFMNNPTLNDQDDAAIEARNDATLGRRNIREHLARQNPGARNDPVRWRELLRARDQLENDEKSTIGDDEPRTIVPDSTEPRKLFRFDPPDTSTDKWSGFEGGGRDSDGKLVHNGEFGRLLSHGERGPEEPSPYWQSIVSSAKDPVDSRRDDEVMLDTEQLDLLRSKTPGERMELIEFLLRGLIRRDNERNEKIIMLNNELARLDTMTPSFTGSKAVDALTRRKEILSDITMLNMFANNRNIHKDALEKMMKDSRDEIQRNQEEDEMDEEGSATAALHSAAVNANALTSNQD